MSAAGCGETCGCVVVCAYSYTELIGEAGAELVAFELAAFIRSAAADESLALEQLDTEESKVNRGG